MKTLFLIHHHAKWILLAGVLLLLLAYFQKEDLPPPEEIYPQLLQNPVQEPTQKNPFTQTYQDKKYLITPKYDYELYGLIVTERALDKTWYNLGYKRDPFNIKDICVIWGGNLLSNDYQKVQYKSGLWTCYFRYKGNVVFIGEALSNNHILPANESISRQLSKAQIGDQIYFKGQLVDYSVDGGPPRNTSINRVDTGNGACEVVYVEDFEILKDTNAFWEFIYSFSKLLILFPILVWIYVNVIRPYRVRKKGL